MSGAIRIYVKKKVKVDRESIAAVATQYSEPLVVNMCRKVMNQATIDCPVDTGILRGSHGMKVRKLKTKIVGTVFNRAKYAAAVHDGTKPHTIRARKKKSLKFSSGGETIFVKSVRHPGAKARPWLKNAAKKVSVREGWTFKEVSE